MRVDPINFSIVWTVAATLIVAGLFVDDRIVRHVCKREGRRYTWLWWTSLYWFWRMLTPAWFLRDAKEAGFPILRPLLFGALIVYLAASIYLKPVRVLPA